MAEYWGFKPNDNEGSLFVSYNSRDWARIAPIALELSKKGQPIWYDYGLLPGTSTWETQISSHIRKCKTMIIFVTNGIFEREDAYVMIEYEQAKNLGKTIVPVFLDGDILDKSFFTRWSELAPESFDKYSGNITRLMALQGISGVSGQSAETIASRIITLLSKGSVIGGTSTKTGTGTGTGGVIAGTGSGTGGTGTGMNFNAKNLAFIAMTVVAVVAVITVLVMAGRSSKPVEPPVTGGGGTTAATSGSGTTTTATAPVEEEEVSIGPKGTVRPYSGASGDYFDPTRSYSVGNHLLFGNYEQDNNWGNDAESIEWRVLDVKGNSMVLISEYLLDSKRYYASETPMTWEKCELRTWLNGSFYDSAFSDDEKEWVVTVNNTNNNNPKYGTNGGNNTTDNVYCLDVVEASNYFANDNERKAYPTAYAEANGIFVNTDNGGTGWWWLRTPGKYTYGVSGVMTNGEVAPFGHSVTLNDRGVRPVITVALS